MKILVTGGAGFIGSNLIRYLITNTRHEVVNFDKLTYAGNLESLADIESSDRYTFVKGDLCDADCVHQLVTDTRPNGIMHLAAESHVDRSIDGPGEFIQTNIIGTFHLLQAALGHYKRLDEDSQKAFRFLHVSTDEVYGSLGFEDAAFSEITPYDPHSPYSASKASSDHLVRAWNTTYGLPVMVTNCSNNYGPYQFPEKLIPIVILKCLRGEKIPVYGNGKNIRDWLYVEDHCKALEVVLNLGKPGETYNIGSNNELTNIELVKQICSILDELAPNQQIGRYEKLISFVADRPGHDLRYAINANKIQNELGWKPTREFFETLIETVRWYLENQNWLENCTRKTTLNEKTCTAIC